jgi:SAM-dependent methyltransferase
MTTFEIGTADAAVVETFVVPRYLSLFGEPAVESILPTERARVAHLGCRTGYPDALVARQLPDSEIVGVDASPSAIELARAKAHLIDAADVQYVVAGGFPSPLQAKTFSHVVSIHPLAPMMEDRQLLFAEASRLISPSGQLVLALPLRGSFQEMIDLLREYALKKDAGEVGRSAEAAALLRPNVEMMAEELETAGFEDIDIDVRRTSIEFQSGRDFFEDPVTRLLVLPDLRAHLGLSDLVAPFAYVREAIDRYWAEEKFDLSVAIGLVSARRYV